MRTLQSYLSDFVKLFIGPHQKNSPAHSWDTIILLLVSIVGLFILLFNFGH